MTTITITVLLSIFFLSNATPLSESHVIMGYLTTTDELQKEEHLDTDL